MILMPIMLNQSTIGAVYARRLDKRTPGRDVYVYEWEVTLEGGPTPTHAQGTGLAHNYNDGALVLFAKILKAAGIQA
jgi:hypothetical protein